MYSVTFTDNTTFRQALEALRSLHFFAGQESKHGGRGVKTDLDVLIAGLSKFVESVVLFDKVIVDSFPDDNDSLLTEHDFLSPLRDINFFEEIDLDKCLDLKDITLIENTLVKATQSNQLWNYLSDKDSLWKNNGFLESCLLNLLYYRKHFKFSGTDIIVAEAPRKATSKIFQNVLRSNKEQLIRLNSQELMFRVGSIGMAIRTLLYLRASERLNISYFPSIFRTPFMEFFYLSNHQFPSSAELAVNKIKEAQTSLAVELNALLDRSAIQLEIPVVLAAVLKRSENFQELIPNLIKIRNSNSAIEFRKWSLSVDALLKEGNFPKALKELKKLQYHLDHLREQYSGGTKTVSVTLGFSPVSVSIPVSLPAKIKSLLSTRKARFLFLYDLFQTALTVRSIENEIERLMGSKIDPSEKHHFWFGEKFYEHYDIGPSEDPTFKNNIQYLEYLMRSINHYF